MSRQSSERKRTAREQRRVAELRADLEQLRAVTADCYSSDCGCHWREWQEISSIRLLLGEEADVRAYVSRLWAEDWDSLEDAAYDEEAPA